MTGIFIIKHKQNLGQDTMAGWKSYDTHTMIPYAPRGINGR